MLVLLLAGGAGAAIMSWRNNITNDSSLDITIDPNIIVTFEANSDQFATFTWYVNGETRQQNIGAISATFTSDFPEGYHTIWLKVNDTVREEILAWNIKDSRNRNPIILNWLHCIEQRHRHLSVQFRQ